MDPVITLILDSILALFLLGVMVLCFFVYRRLSIIKDGHEELSRLVDNLNQAVTNAQKSVNGIKVAAIESEGELQATIKKARSMVDELSLMTEVGDNLANRLEAGSTQPAAEVKTSAIQEQSKEQSDILAALKKAR